MYATVRIGCGILCQERPQDALRERLDLWHIRDARIGNGCQAVRVPARSQQDPRFRFDEGMLQSDDN
jgi:hypothetical protein